jgi:hypothetical protein
MGAVVMVEVARGVASGVAGGVAIMVEVGFWATVGVAVTNVAVADGGEVGELVGVVVTFTSGARGGVAFADGITEYCTDGPVMIPHIGP